MMTPYNPNGVKGKKPYKSWLKDGVNGGPCSMDVLVNWLSKKSNYSKWKGDDCERIPKKSLLESIIEEMRKVGIYHRLAKDVASKISTLQSNYRLAREWKDVDGKKLLETGATEQAVHEELLKRFPYWDALDEVFNNTKNNNSWPMSLSSIMHSNQQHQQHNEDFEDELENEYNYIKRKRRLSENSLMMLNQQQRYHNRSSIDNTSDSASTTYSTTSNNNNSNNNNNHNNNNNNISPTLNNSTPTIIRPLPRVLPSPIQRNTNLDIDNRRDHILAESLLQVTREKEAGRMKRSQDMLQFLREKRMERDQLLIEKELTKRVKAKAELVKNLMEAGFDKNAIAEQLNML